MSKKWKTHNLVFDFGILVEVKHGKEADATLLRVRQTRPNLASDCKVPVSIDLQASILLACNDLPQPRFRWPSTRCGWRWQPTVIGKRCQRKMQQLQRSISCHHIHDRLPNVLQGVLEIYFGRVLIDASRVQIRNRLESALRFAFRCHQFAEGFDDEASSLFTDVHVCHPQCTLEAVTFILDCKLMI